ncbi:hypothetical protein EKH55_1207 [Sinorhizobium alkalisoli]|nr:hypothetical protein EKH55_1207 [Sinorhizobium alkalisoli]
MLGAASAGFGCCGIAEKRSLLSSMDRFKSFLSSRIGGMLVLRSDAI